MCHGAVIYIQRAFPTRSVWDVFFPTVFMDYACVSVTLCSSSALPGMFISTVELIITALSLVGHRSSCTHSNKKTEKHVYSLWEPYMVHKELPNGVQGLFVYVKVSLWGAKRFCHLHSVVWFSAKLLPRMRANYPHCSNSFLCGLFLRCLYWHPNKWDSKHPQVQHYH